MRAHPRGRGACRNVGFDASVGRERSWTFARDDARGSLRICRLARTESRRASMDSAARRAGRGGRQRQRDGAHLYGTREQQSRQVLARARRHEWGEVAASLLAAGVGRHHATSDIAGLVRSDRARTWSSDGVVERSEHTHIAPMSGDPLGIGEQHCMNETEAFDATFDTVYPDAIVQIARIVRVLEKWRHYSVSGARLGFSRAVRADPSRVVAWRAASRTHAGTTHHQPPRSAGTPRRTVDVMASACAALGLSPFGVEGTPFL